MVQERHCQGGGKGVCWSLRFWSVTVISVLLLSACFITGCVVTYQFAMDKPDTRLSELHAHHSNPTCLSEGTRVSEKMWGCCPSNWKSFGSSCYLIPTKENIWSISEQKCFEMGAHLVVINTEAEQNFITQQLNKSVVYFLGLSDPQGNGKWQWIDNTPFSKSVSSVPLNLKLDLSSNRCAPVEELLPSCVSCRFWHPNEPNLPEERCASIVYWHPMKWGWNDVFCDSKYNSICEMRKTYL
ncbi:C-type lectin domain family 6 member A isoform X1 [Mesocricetus auratus]|uniref:C-type lectin domain family 6 member A isoform X1 n=1 Tax=Mesocricetus auratus TaxID=10036 RepID=A0ABM2WVJ8_MESAU|nr:C-type lectin domain family 6 member A isoform X1 [Mesocricetus auratus]